ncbi:CsgG/HfaB family protein [Tunicatimonas pelagia]|uniref:CsgG/HfaB family protein n=1 Tax=Tunicatimonas pelagia TaxID=931531 RepID=UPI00266523D7|nr:CsgG/HfaB family protein [Tunicatimonas pelagia]WKN45252.1 CsgG/HfaB family protein [Tunicatimonas pelagia]
MRSYLLLICLLLGGTRICAQSDAPMIIGITDFIFDGNEEVNRKYSGSLSNNVYEAFSESKMFKLVERSKLSEINEELDRNREEWHILSDFLVEQGKILGASHLLVGEIEFIRFEEAGSSVFASLLSDDDTKDRNERDGLKMLKAAVDLNFNIVDVETGEIIETESLDFGGDAIQVGSTDSASAVLDLKEDIYKKTNRFIYKHWPQIYDIVKIEERGKFGKPALFYINGGAANNLEQGNKFQIVKVDSLDLGGGNIEIIERSLGEAVIYEINSPQVSLCRVVSGRKEILESTDNGETVFCKRLF